MSYYLYIYIIDLSISIYIYKYTYMQHDLIYMTTCSKIGLWRHCAFGGFFLSHFCGLRFCFHHFAVNDALKKSERPTAAMALGVRGLWPVGPVVTK